MPPKDFTKINKILIRKNLDENGNKITEKEMREKLSNIRKKVKIGKRLPFKMVRSSSYACGLSTPKNENIANLIYNIYGNKAEELLNKNYEEFITEKSRRKFIFSSSPRYINPKVEEMKKKEEERKAYMLSDINIHKKEEKRVLYKLKMFQNVGSKVTENIKKFKTFKPIMSNKNNNKSIIKEIQNDIKKKEQSNINL